MQLRGVRRTLIMLALAAPLAGCAAGGLGSPTPGGSSASPKPPGDSWVVVVTGSATPSPTVSFASPSASPTGPPLLAPPDPGCDQNWVNGQVMIPLTITVGKRSITATWPRYGSSSSYRIAAVPQNLVYGKQPELRWQATANTGGCTITGTVTGLLSGKPYIIWMDAPETGHLMDGTRNPYSGRSGVVYPL